MASESSRELIILPVLKAVRGPRGGFILTEKYMKGADGHATIWPGPVTSLVDLMTVPTTDMDQIEVMPEEATTGLELRPKKLEDLAERLKDAALVSTFLSPYELPTARLCQRLGVPIVFVSEYSVKTEFQIIDAEGHNPLRRLRRRQWIRGAEQKRRKALALAAGLQCNGTPTFESYGGAVSNAMLFFDNRVPESLVISKAALAEKTGRIAQGKPLRLVFGGRMIPMKGVADLVPFADVLRHRNVPFQLDIYGDGPLRPLLERQIIDLDLSGEVRLRGVLDFETGWVPTLKREADLFICCHPQGDPSSTYSEVMACGVPIAGYDNDALTGIIGLSDAGWATPMHDLEALADVVARLHRDRSEIAVAANRARSFAIKHAFEETMRRRTQHLIEASRLSGA